MRFMGPRIELITCEAQTIGCYAENGGLVPFEKEQGIKLCFFQAVDKPSYIVTHWGAWKVTPKTRYEEVMVHANGQADAWTEGANLEPVHLQEVICSVSSSIRLNELEWVAVAYPDHNGLQKVLLPVPQK